MSILQRIMNKVSGQVSEEFFRSQLLDELGSTNFETDYADTAGFAPGELYFFTYSSKRYKKDVEPLESAINTISKLQGVSYNWKDTGKKDFGFIAEDVGKVIPEIVEWSADPQYANTMDYTRIISFLVEAVKEQQNKIKIALPFLKIRSKNFNELYQQSEFILIKDHIKIRKENKKYLNNQNFLIIKNLANKLKNIKWSKETIIETIKTYSFEKKIDFKDVAKLIRIAIVGTTNSPGIYDMMLVLGKLEIIRRFTILER